MQDFYLLPHRVTRLVSQNIRMPSRKIFLSFDDGPDPSSTPYLLEILRHFQARATFFCTGRQVEKHPSLYKDILQEGHSVGNHGFDHLMGWVTPNRKYKEDVEKASRLIQSALFRPPYGKLSPWQWLALRKEYSLVFWNLLFRDYHLDFHPDRAFLKAKKHLKPGRIIGMHDQGPSLARTKTLLVLILEHLEKDGLATDVLVPRKEAGPCK